MIKSLLKFHPGRTAVVVLALAASALLAPSAASAAMELESFTYETTEPGGSGLLQASRHPDQTVATFKFPADAEGNPFESPRDIAVDLPLGSVGSPASIPTCTDAKLAIGGCPPESQVGTVLLGFKATGTSLKVTLPVYNLAPPPGILAQFGFFTGQPIHLTATVHSQPQYGITITTRQINQTLPYTEIVNTFWGVPSDPSHDEDRGFCASLPHGSGCKITSEAPETAFLTNPSACSNSALATSRVNSWLEPEVPFEALAGNVDGSGEPLGVVDCAAPDFSPSIEARPTTEAADSPSGLHVDVHLPQNQGPDEPAEAQLRDATIVLPEGLTINPASGAGLGACSADQIGLTTPVGEQSARFDEAPVTCPDAAKLGTVAINTPLLAQPLQGAMYLAEPHQNPFGSLIALYIVVEDPQTGVIIKIAGKADLNPQTGRITTVFPGAPQLPFEDLDVNLFKGSRAALRTPLSCGVRSSESTLVPWTAPEGPERHPGDSARISSAPNGGPCPASDSVAPDSRTLAGGTVNPAAGAYSPFRLKLTRPDGSQPIKSLEATLPAGLLGKLAGISYCPDASLAAAAGRSGRQELESSSCPGSSRLGSVTVGAGAGPNPLYVSGNAYLAGPYKGAPLSLAIITPAVAGPFDLGTVVVRTALYVDPETTQIHAVSDPIPTLLEGIPLDLRSVAVNLDRPQFILNPTNCDGGAIAATTVSVFDQSTALTTPFAAGGCRALKFKPKLALRLSGGTKRRGHPSLRAVLTYPQGAYANIGRAQVSLPGDMLLDQSHIRDLCRRAQIAAGACPSSSIYGFARAYTPLLEKPLEGPVFLAPSNHELPDLVAELNGQIRVLLRGKVDTDKATHGLRTTFEAVPDAPVSRFELRLKGRKKGLIQNSRDICRVSQRAKASFDGQNGKIADYKPKIKVRCKSGGKKKHHGNR